MKKLRGVGEGENRRLRLQKVPECVLLSGGLEEGLCANHKCTRTATAQGSRMSASLRMDGALDFAQSRSSVQLWRRGASSWAARLCRSEWAAPCVRFIWAPLGRAGSLTTVATSCLPSSLVGELDQWEIRISAAMACGKWGLLLRFWTNTWHTIKQVVHKRRYVYL